jgi:hypothetical protein
MAPGRKAGRNFDQLPYAESGEKPAFDLIDLGDRWRPFPFA